MAISSTLIIALRFKTGVVFASDSQASDLVQAVRWPVTKAKKIEPYPLVMAFSGSLGISERAREDVGKSTLRTSVFKKRELVREAIASALKKHYTWVSEFPSQKGQPLLLWALAACFAEGKPQIIEFETSGDSCFHEHFHGIGSGGGTAYAIWRALGGRQLEALKEGLAVHVALRILQTAIEVNMTGVSDPFTVFIVDKKGARQLSQTVVDAEMQAAQEWEQKQMQRLLSETE